MRFGPGNRMFLTTDTEGLGDYLMGPAFIQHQDLSILPDGTIVPYRIAYGTQWECGFGTKEGQLLIRTKVIESTNGNAKVNWGPGVKPLAVDRLASMVVVCRDGSITINDDVETGETVLQGLKISDVMLSLVSAFISGVDLELTPNNVENPTSFRFDVLRKAFIFENAQDNVTLNFDRTIGSTQLVNVVNDVLFTFSNARIGQKLLVECRYDPFGYRNIIWPNSIRWASRYVPATTPIGGKADSFEFQRLPDENVGSEEDPELEERYLGWPISVERPIIIELEGTPNVTAGISIDQGSAGGPNEQQYLSATVESDRMDFILTGDNLVTAGTFKLTIEETFSNPDGVNHEITGIPYNVKAFQLLELIWTQTPLTPFMINVGSGNNGEFCSSQLNIGDEEIEIVWLGRYRYYGYVISIDSTNLTGGTYGVSATGSGSGSEEWIFHPNQCYEAASGDNPPIGSNFGKLTFMGDVTESIYAGPDMSTTVRQALEDLPSIGEGNILVSFDAYGVFTFEFINELGSQPIEDEIKWADGFLPQNIEEEGAFGQVYGTIKNGEGPSSTNEVNTITVGGNPIVGEVIYTVLGNEVRIPVWYDASEITSLLREIDGFRIADTPTTEAYDNFKITSGPLPGEPIVITFVRDFSAQNLEDSTIDVYSAGAAVVDHAECDEARILVATGFNGGEGTYSIIHKNPMPGKTVHTVLINEGSEVVAEFTNLVHFYPDLITVGLSGSTTESGRNQLDRLTAEDPEAEGRVVIQVAGTRGNPGKRITFITGASNSDLKAKIEKKTGLGVTITGGPFPEEPIEFEWTGQFSHEFRAITLVPFLSIPSDDGSMDIINEVIYPASGTITWLMDSEVGTLNWNEVDPPGIPEAWIDTYQVFHDPRNDLDRQTIIAKNWFHSGEGGGGGSEVNPFEFLPGIGIEINHTVDPGDGHDIYEIDRLKTLTVDLDAATIVCDLQASTGEGHKFTIAANRNVDVTNEKQGEFYSIQCVQGGTGNYSLTFLFDVEWVEGFQPVQTPVVGKSDLFHFECLEESGPYNVARFRGWVETTERPQPLEDTASPTAANEVQQIIVSPVPIGGTWTITFMGFPTTAMAFNASATAVRLAMQALPSVGNGNVLVSGGRLGVVPFRVEFVNGLGGINLPQLTVQTAGLQF